MTRGYINRLRARLKEARHARKHGLPCKDTVKQVHRLIARYFAEYPDARHKP